MKILTKKEIQAVAPAAFELGRDEKRTSEKYQTLHTSEVIKFMGNEGYKVTGAQQMYAFKKDNRFTRHLILFTHEEFLGEDGGNLDVVPRVLMFNSHNGTTALKLQTGFYRFVCANGLIVGDTTSLVKLRHSANGLDLLNDQLQHSAQVARNSGNLIEKWKNKTLSPGAMETFAQEAVKLRTRSESSVYDAASVLEPRREEDDKNDLWTVFNRVQENLMQGKIRGEKESGRLVTLRPLTNIRRSTEFNQALWSLAEKVAA